MADLSRRTRRTTTADAPRPARARVGGARRAISTIERWMASERQIRVGNVAIGGDAPVVVQSMTLTKTHDVEATTAQIAALASAGCEIVRVAVPKTEDADALPKIVRLSPIPVIADIHFNASLALKAIEGGVAAVRINPGNIGGANKVAEVVRAAQKAGIPMRIGANSGSLPKHLAEVAQRDQAQALVEAALEEVRLLESLGFYDFKISVKSSHVPTMIRAYRMLSAKVPYPLHLGVTEAGTPIAGGRDTGFVYAHGRVLKKVSSDILIDELFHEIDRWIAEGMQRPKRLKMAKPAALAMAEASLIPLGE